MMLTIISFLLLVLPVIGAGQFAYRYEKRYYAKQRNIINGVGTFVVLFAALLYLTVT